MGELEVSSPLSTIEPAKSVATIAVLPTAEEVIDPALMDEEEAETSMKMKKSRKKRSRSTRRRKTKRNQRSIRGGRKRRRK